MFILQDFTIEHYSLKPNSHKREIKNFYKKNNYSAKFMGLDDCFILSSKNEIIASALISRLHPDNDCLFLHALVVAKAYQRQGLGNKLLRAICNQYQLLVCFSNSKLENLYLLNQFKCVHENQLNDLLKLRYQHYLKRLPDLKIFYHNALT